jgi:hypothetical protein
VHLEIPKASSVLGLGYTIALFGFTVTLVVLLLGSGPARLSGLGLALVGLGGYQSGSPVELSLTLGGVIALATGLSRSMYRGAGSPLSADDWKASVASLAARLAGPSPSEADAPATQILAGDGPGDDRTTIHLNRDGRPVEVVLTRSAHVLREVLVTVGVPGDGPPDAVLESHETWLARRPEDRPTAPRIKTGDPGFDRKWGVYGEAPLSDRAVRRRLLDYTDASIRLWAGVAAASVATASPSAGASEPATSARALRSVSDFVGLLGDLVTASATTAPSSLPPASPSA